MSLFIYTNIETLSTLRIYIRVHKRDITATLVRHEITRKLFFRIFNSKDQNRIPAKYPRSHVMLVTGEHDSNR